MKKIAFFLLLVSALTFTSFSASKTTSHAKTTRQLLVGDEVFVITTGVGIGAREFILTVERQGNEAGEGFVEFDIDVMYNSNPSQVQTHHVYMYHGQLTLTETRQSSVVIGTDVDPVGSAYNIIYY